MRQGNGVLGAAAARAGGRWAVGVLPCLPRRVFQKSGWREGRDKKQSQRQGERGLGEREGGDRRQQEADKQFKKS